MLRLQEWAAHLGNWPVREGAGSRNRVGAVARQLLSEVVQRVGVAGEVVCGEGDG